MERILIIGCGGSGKTTLARKLGEKLDLPVVHLDKIWWTGNWEHITQEEFDEALERELEQPRWIMDGNFSRTMPQRLERCDTVIYLDFSTATCLFGVLKRILSNYGKTRPDMGGNCPERLDWEFLKWVCTYNKQNRERNYGWINSADHAETYAFKNRRQLKKFLAQL